MGQATTFTTTALSATAIVIAAAATTFINSTTATTWAAHLFAREGREACTSSPQTPSPPRHHRAHSDWHALREDAEARIGELRRA